MNGLSRLSERWLGWLTRRFAPRRETVTPSRGCRDHVIILDGTLSSLAPGAETNAGLTYKLLREGGGALSLYYEAGLQWPDWRATPDVMLGRGINRQIRRAYGVLASRYRPGDRIYLLGYSRGAYAVRSLAGIIDRLGLLRAEAATERNLRQLYRHYQGDPDSAAAKAFSKAYCQDDIAIDMVGVWDTVKALGFRVPVLWRFTEEKHGFHNHELGPATRRGFHALALDETRRAYAPVLWTCPPHRAGQVEQVWFPGSHGDVGGQLGGFDAARPVSNIALVWMLERLELCGLTLPEGWRARFPCDPAAPKVGTWRGFGKFFLLRQRRVVGQDPSERLHETVPASDRAGHAAPLEASF